MKRIFAVSFVVFLVTSLPAAAKWEGTANFYDEPTPYMAKMQAGQFLSFGNPITFTYWKKAAGPATQYRGIVQAISVEGVRHMQIHIFFSRGEAKKAEGELNLEWREPGGKSRPWWRFWEW